MFAAHLARMHGHDIACLVTAEPESEESMLCHHPNTRHVRLQAESMHVPVVFAGSANGDETGALEGAIIAAKSAHSVDGIVHGGISSAYQRDTFARIGRRAHVEVLSPLWHADESRHLYALLDAGFKFIVASVSADGLDDAWLGREITRDAAAEIGRLGVEFGFSPSFEGGDAETFVLDCPLFESEVVIRRATKVWDGYRGRFDIEEADLWRRARHSKDRATRGDKEDRLGGQR